MSANSPAADREHALLQQANRRVLDGDWQGAARLLMHAADLAESQGRGHDAARGRQMAASLFRFAGDTGSALESARALASGGGDPRRVAFAAAAERGEAFAAAGDARGAVPAYREALEHADALSLPPTWRAAVLRRLGAALARAGEIVASREIFAAARALHAQADDAAGAALVDIECAEALIAAAAWPDAAPATQAASRSAQVLGDAGLAARAALAAARIARQEGDLARALAAADEARGLALRAVEPVSYFAAASVLAQLHDGAGDRVAAYRVLAAAWATLGDLLGRDVGASWVEPLLLAFAAQWGDAEFARVKSAHEAQRRAAREAGGG